MRNETSKAKIVGYTFVLLVVVYLALTFGALFPIHFWSLLLLVSIIILIVIFLYRRSQAWSYYLKELVIVNISLSVFLFTLYFFIFGLASGLSKPAISLGLPILIGIVITIIFTICLIWKRNINRGRHGFSVGLGTYVYTAIILLFYSNLLFVTPQNNPKEEVITDENRILKLSLEELCNKGLSYSVVAPETSLDDSEQIMNSILVSSNPYLKNGYYTFKGLDSGSVVIEETAFQELVNRFIEVNHSPRTMEIASQPEKGYYIDYDKQFTGWLDYPQLIWRLTHPINGSLVKLSAPAYDKERDLIIIYIDEGGKYLYLIKDEYIKISVLLDIRI
jgi:hypothetical protein